MKFKKRYTLIPIILFIFIYFVYMSYAELRELTISQYNKKQTELISQTTLGIEKFFYEIKSDATYLSTLSNIIDLNDFGKENIINFYEKHNEYLKGITRVNLEGKIQFTYPLNKNIIGSDISNQKHIKKIFSNHKPVLSDVFKTVQGYQAVALHIPVFKNDTFNGTLAFLINFNTISEKFVSAIDKYGLSRTQVLSENGIELYCFNFHHIGKSVFENLNNKKLTNKYKNILKENFGTTSFNADVIVNEKVKNVKLYVVYKKISIIGQNWLLLVSTPEYVILNPILEFRNKWLYISLALTFMLAVFVFLSVRASTILIEEQKRKALEEKLAESELNMQMMIEKTPVGIAITDSESKPILFNKKLKELFGYNLEEIKSFEDWQKKVYPDEKYRKKMEKSWMKGLELSEKENKAYGLNGIKIKCKSGDYKICDVTVYSQGNFHITVFVDQTEKEKSVKEKKILEERLNRSKKMEALGLLASGVAHDLNNILSGVVTLPEVILYKMEKDNPLRGKIEEIQNSGSKAAAVVSDLLTIARGVASKKRIYSLDEIVSDYGKSPECQNLKNKYSTVNLKLSLNSAEHRVFGSDIHIRKCLMNLVTNAFEIIEENGEVEVKTEYVKLTNNYSGYQKIKDGEYIVLSVKDNGKGIDKENLSRIFEPFFTRKQMGMSGTGLGLAIVWNTMEDHHGFVDVKSEINVGTTFKLYFPVTDKEMLDTGKYRALQELNGKGEKILIVDDEKIQREIALQFLSDLNYTPVAVEDGESAIKKVKEGSYDLILLDMIMPNGISGLETYKKIKEINKNQKAIIVTGLSFSKDAEETLKMGASTIITKPYSISELANIIREVLDG